MPGQSAPTASTQTPKPAVVLIPAYQPGEALLALVADLISAGMSRIVVVDDGSTGNKHLFDSLRERPECAVLVHSVNLGKGRALKTGINHILLHYPDCRGIVTVDADGQHAPADVLKIGAQLQAGGGGLLIGSRVFGKDIPLRSWIGNVITRNVLHAVTGLRLGDSQSGLRGIPMQLAPMLLRVEGEQYEYEMNMLIAAGRESIPIRQVPIETIYLENNRSSHFNPIFDSMKIYFVLLRYGLTSLITSLIDQVAFFIALHAGLSVAGSLIVGRGVASVFNLASNRRFVFSAVRTFGWPVMLAKIVVESGLFLFCFIVNREFVFARPASAERRAAD